MTPAARMAAIARGDGGWFSPPGPDSELVLSSRVRLARNIAATRFTSRAGEHDLERIYRDVLSAAEAAPLLRPRETLRIDHLDELDRHLLVERHLISAEFARGGPGRALIPGVNDTLSVMVNEEDHLRVQSIHAGLQIHECWEAAAALDRALGQVIDYAFQTDLGFLTACPSNVGTGLRVSVLMHLPSLVLAEEIRKVVDSVLQIGLSVRGFYGEGSDVIGNFFQISNQITLGKSEEELVDIMEHVTREILSYEARAREYLRSEALAQVEDKVYRAVGTLQNCRMISTAEVVAAASALRLGVALALPGVPPAEVINALVIFAQPAHVERLAGRRLSPPARRIARANLVRRLVRGGEVATGETQA
jgi:protein arginine kinase